MPGSTEKKSRKDKESDWNPDPNVFTELLSTHKLRKFHNISLESSPDDPLYNVVGRTSLTHPFDIELHDGAYKTGSTLGVARLHIKTQEIGLGDPNYIIEEDGDPRKRMVWETLRKPKLFSTKEFLFDYGDGKERKHYVWRRVRDLFPRPFTDLELWEVGKGLEDGDGLPVAIWKRNKTWGPNLKDGSFFLRRASDAAGENDAESKRWEVMMLLTALSLIELAGGGGGGPGKVSPEK